MSKPMSPAARLYQEAFTKAAQEAAARAELAGVEPAGLKPEPEAGLVSGIVGTSTSFATLEVSHVIFENSNFDASRIVAAGNKITISSSVESDSADSRKRPETLVRR